MNDDAEFKASWLDEVERLIAHWEHETETIKEREIDPEECTRISDGFQRAYDMIMVKRPVSITDDAVVTRFEQLGNKLNSTLAMVCCSTKKR